MKPIEQEIASIKGHHAQMWEMVQQQVSKAFTAMKNYDRELAKQILTREKMVNAQELVVDHHCENFIALFNPVAVDLRFVISLLKINNNLERIGDFAESIALFVLFHQQGKLDETLWNSLQLGKMSSTAIEMLATARAALETENSALASHVLGMDDTIDQINSQTVPILAQYIVANPTQAEQILHLHAVIRRIERIGDRSSNIAEDIVFYIDAKELRHNKK